MPIYIYDGIYSSIEEAQAQPQAQEQEQEQEQAFTLVPVGE